MYKFLFFFLFSSCLAFAQVAKDKSASSYSVKHYTDEDGLPQNMVKRIEQDDLGYIWLLTEAILVRFDGHNFDKFNLLYSELNDDTFHDFKYGQLAGSPLIPTVTNNRGKHMRIDNGKIIVDTTYSNTVRKELSLNSEKEGDYIAQGLPNVTEKLYKPSKYIVPIGNSGYFICSQTGIQYFKKGRLQKKYECEEYNPWNFFVIGNDLYQITKDHKIFRFSSSGSSTVPERLDLNQELKSILSLRGLRILWNNASGHTYFCSENAMYAIALDSDGQLKANLILSGFDFKGKAIESVYLNEKSGMIFLGSFTEGLFVLTPRQFITLREVNNIRLDNVYYAQTKYQKNGVLSSHGNIFLRQPEDGKIVKKMLPGMKERTKHDKYSMLTDDKGFIWIKSVKNLLKFDPTGTLLISEWKMKDEINQIYQGKDHNIYIGTKFSGIYVISAHEQNPKPILFVKNIPDITWMHDQSPHEFWVGTGKGLYWVNPKTKAVKHIAELGNLYIRSMHMTKSEELWVSTYNNGFYLLKNRKLTHFPLDPKGYLAHAHCIFEDEKGFFWITTNKGLFQISKNDLLSYAVKAFPIYYQFYSKWNGFISNEFNGGCQPCAVRLDNGIVSLPSMDGIVWFTPEQIIKETLPASIIINQVFVNGQEEKNPGDSLLIPESPDMVRIVLRTPHFGDDNNLKMMYSFQKDNEEASSWYQVDNRDKTIEMHKLGPGKYIINIYKIREFGVGNESVKKIVLIVGKQWYETRWAWIAYMILLGALIYGIMQLRLRTIMAQNALLEHKISERTAHLQTMLDSLRISENELARQSLLHLRTIASISHDIQSPVKFIGTAARAIPEFVDTGQMDRLVKMGELIAYTSDQIFHLIEGMVTFFKPQIKGNKIEEEETDLHKLVSEKIAIFSGIIETHVGEVRVEIDEGYRVFTNPKLLGIVIHNLMDNAIKAKNYNKIVIATEERDGDLHLIIADQGPGLPLPMLDWVNTTTSPEDSSLQVVPDYSGLGLILVKEICQIIGMKIFVENKQGAHIHLIFDSGKYKSQATRARHRIEPQ